MSFYGVRSGLQTGVFASWKDCAKHVLRVPNAVYRGGFRSAQAAQAFVDGIDPLAKPRRINDVPIDYRGRPKLDSFLNRFKHPRRPKPLLFTESGADSQVAGAEEASSKSGARKKKAPDAVKVESSVSDAAAADKGVAAAAESGAASGTFKFDGPNPRRVFFDGGARSEETGGAGYLVMEGQRIRALGWVYLRNQQVSNNIAEYQGLVAALISARKVFGPQVAFDVFGDSMLVVNQLNQKIRVLSRHLQPLYLEARRLKPGGGVVRHVPRSLNFVSDILANLAMDLGKSGVVVDAPQFATLENQPLDPAMVKKLIVDVVE